MKTGNIKIVCVTPGLLAARAPRTWVCGSPAGNRPAAGCGLRGSWNAALLCLLLLRPLVSAAQTNAAAFPPPARIRIDFDRDVRPVLKQSCLRCHGQEKPKSHFRLTTRDWALKGGDENPDDIVPGDSGRSHLIQYVAGMVPDMQMPPPGKATPAPTQ